MSSVDVIIPCYNYGHILEECVESVLEQQGVDLRVLILDDASPDETPAVGRTLAARDSRIEYRRHTVNRGHIATYNEGLEWNRADYVVLLSADDLLAPAALARATHFLDANPDVGLAYGRHIDFWTDGPRSAVAPVPECGGQVVTYEEFLTRACLLGHTPIESPAAIVRTNIHRAAGNYRPELPHSGDTELWLRLAAFAPVGILDADQAFRRWHDRNMTHGYTPLRRYKEQRAAFEAHFRDFANRIGEVAKYRRRLDEGIAEAAFWSAYNAFDRGELASCGAFLRHALSLDPSIRSRPDWSRLRWKRLMGPKVFFRLRALVETLRAG